LESVNVDQAALDEDLRAVQYAALDTEDHLNEAVGNLAALLGKGGFRPTELTQYDEVQVISSRSVPIDLIRADGVPLGLRVVISHVVAADRGKLEQLLKRESEDRTRDLNHAALLAIADLPPSVSRRDHDIVKAALKLSDRITVDIAIEPRTDESLSYLARKDIQILHIDTHGTPDGIELGSRDRRFLPVQELPNPIQIPFLLLVGCSTGSGDRSLGPQLVQRGASAVLGMAFDFRSGAPSGGSISDPTFYDTLWDALLGGQTVGSAVLKAKKTLPENIYSAIWLLFGDADLKFRAATEE
jgi:hypothetical protein